MDDIGSKISAIIGSIIGLAVLAVIVSDAANTTNVLQAFFGGVSNLIGVAISPVTGQSVNSGQGLLGGPWQAGGNSGGYSAYSGTGGLSFGGSSNGGFGITGSVNLGGLVSSLTGSSGGLGSLFGGSSGGGGFVDDGLGF